MPKKENIITLMEKEFKNFLVSTRANFYNNYGMLTRDYCLLSLPEKPKD